MMEENGLSPVETLLAEILEEREREWQEERAAACNSGSKTRRNKYTAPVSPAIDDTFLLPDGWAVASLEQLTSSTRVICYGILMPKEHVPDGILYVKVRDMRGDRINISGLNRTTPEIASKFERASLKADDILLSIRGTFGRVAVVPPELEGGNITQDTARIAVSALLDRRFVEWHLRSPDTQNYFKRVARGVAVRGVNIGGIRPCPIRMPPVKQQTAIVEKLDELLSDLDVGVAVLERAKANLKRYRAAVLKAAVEGNLTKQWRAENPDVEPASELLDRILVERRERWEAEQLAKYEAKGKEPSKGWEKKYKEPAEPAERLVGELPKNWALASLEQITDPVRLICYGILMPKENVEDGVLYVKVRDMRGDRINVDGLNRTAPEIAAKYERASLKAGDLLLAIRGTYGRVARVPTELEGGNITQDSARVVVIPELQSEFIEWFLRSPDVQNYFKRVARGVAVKGVNIGDVRPCPILVPPVGEQRVIAQEIERRLSVATQIEMELEHSTVRSTRLRQSILKRAFEGKLVPQDPNDEPASELLARIKTEREAAEANGKTKKKKRATRKKARAK